MSEIDRLKYIVQELDMLCLGASPVKPIRELRNSIIDYLRDENIHYGLDFEQIRQDEWINPNSHNTFHYNCDDCKKNIYKIEVKIFEPQCNECRLKKHKQNKLDLFYAKHLKSSELKNILEKKYLV
jgi:ribosomal protein L37AE/L43A